MSYPVVAIGDVHGQAEWLASLLDRLATQPDWLDSSVVFLGDYVDRGPDVRGAIDRILRLAAEHPGPVTGVVGNHDLAFVRATGLDGRPPSAYWAQRYFEAYDYEQTFEAYLGEVPVGDWSEALARLRDAVPNEHAAWLTGLPWMVEAPGHVFLHNGLSHELAATAEQQLDALRARRWSRSLGPLPGSRTEMLFEPEYPVWLGADRRLSDTPLPIDGRIQVSGHKPVSEPEVNSIRIRLDTSGGHRLPLTACILRGPDAPPEFVRSDCERTF